MKTAMLHGNQFLNDASPLERARHFSKMGVPTIPIPHAQKVPQFPWKEYQERVPTEDDLKRWYGRKMPCNYAIVTGKISGLVAVDADSPEAVRFIEEKLPKTPWINVTARGRQFIYRYPGSVVRNKAKIKTADGQLDVDLRGDGGFIIGPGSTHPTGVKYVADGDWSIDPASLPVFPVSLLTDVPPQRPATRNGDQRSGTGDVVMRARAYLAKVPPAVTGQGGDAHTLSVACRILRGFGLPEDVAFDLLSEWNQHNQPPWSEEELHEKIQNALKYGTEPMGHLLTNGNGYHPENITTVAPAVREAPAAEAPTELPAEKPVLSEVAFYGLAGEVIRAIEPHTEASNAALLTQLLVRFGSQIGRIPYFRAEAVRHHTNEFAVIVGPTAKGRKGSSDSQISRIFEPIEPEFRARNRQHGLSSGEGLIWAIRDAIEETSPIKEKGKFTGQYETVIKDRGIEDKRMLVIEAEFGSTLRIMARDGNSLSAIIRCAWDGDTLKSLTKNNQACATDPHVSIVGHCTSQELIRNLDNTEAANGFGNRFLWIFAERSKLLPDGGAFEVVDLSRITRRLEASMQFARKQGEMRRDDEARELWHAVYGELSEGKVGLLGAMTARAEAHVMRLAMLYALLDESAVIKRPHLEAALALWEFCEESARYIFGDCLGDPIADEIMQALRKTPAGMTKTEIGNLFGRNKTSAQITRALTELLTAGLARFETEETEGRRAERWFAKGRKIG